MTTKLMSEASSSATAAAIQTGLMCWIAFAAEGIPGSASDSVSASEPRSTTWPAVGWRLPIADLGLWVCARSSPFVVEPRSGPVVSIGAGWSSDPPPGGSGADLSRHRIWRPAAFFEVGIEADFGAVYAREINQVLILRARRTLDVALAADLAAATRPCVRAWPKLEGRGDEEVRAWLLRLRAGRSAGTSQCPRRAAGGTADGDAGTGVKEDDIESIEARAGLSALPEVAADW